MAKYATNASGAMLLLNLIQVTESISWSVVPLAMFSLHLFGPKAEIWDSEGVFISFSYTFFCMFQVYNPFQDLWHTPQHLNLGLKPP